MVVMGLGKIICSVLWVKGASWKVTILHPDPPDLFGTHISLPKHWRSAWHCEETPRDHGRSSFSSPENWGILQRFLGTISRILRPKAHSSSEMSLSSFQLLRCKSCRLFKGRNETTLTDDLFDPRRVPESLEIALSLRKDSEGRICRKLSSCFCESWSCWATPQGLWLWLQSVACGN